MEPLDDMWWCNKKQKFKNELDVYSMYVIYTVFFYIKCLHLTGNLPSGTVDGQIIQTLDNFIPRAPQISKLLSSSKGWDGWTKTNQTPQHDISAHTFFNFDMWGRGCLPIFSSRFEYFVHLRSRKVGCLWDASILCRKKRYE